jgi:hypothetical protein
VSDHRDRIGSCEPVSAPNSLLTKFLLQSPWSKFDWIPGNLCDLSKGIICRDISEFESYMPSHAVGLSQVRSPAILMHRVALDYGH